MWYRITVQCNRIHCSSLHRYVATRLCSFSRQAYQSTNLVAHVDVRRNERSVYNSHFGNFNFFTNHTRLLLQFGRNS